MTSQHPGVAPSPGVLFSFGAGVALAMVACGGLCAARISQGSFSVAVVAHLLATVAVVAIMSRQGRVGASSAHATAARVAAQVVGASIGIVVAHSLLRSSSFGAVPWLSERPAQFVNDAVAVFAPLAIVWASSRRPPNTAVLVATLVLVTAYRFTASMWHVDTAHFSYTVQDLVTGEFAGSALGISAFRLLTAA
jgi:hypothetical protein